MKNIVVIMILWTVLMVPLMAAENIDPDIANDQFAYSENAGWVNAEPLGDGGAGIEVLPDKLLGWMYGENIGWVSLSCENTASCGTVNYGVTNDGDGRLGGYAYSENVGWISFSCENTSSCDAVYYGVTIDSFGNFKGFAYSENIGWVRLADDAPVAYKVKTSWTYLCFVDLEDFARFSSQWLYVGLGLNADIDEDEDVDIDDLMDFNGEWLTHCPEGWSLQ